MPVVAPSLSLCLLQSALLGAGAYLSGGSAAKLWGKPRLAGPGRAPSWTATPHRTGHPPLSNRIRGVLGYVFNQCWRSTEFQVKSKGTNVIIRWVIGKESLIKAYEKSSARMKNLGRCGCYVQVVCHVYVVNLCVRVESKSVSYFSTISLSTRQLYRKKIWLSFMYTRHFSKFENLLNWTITPSL